MMYRQLYFLNQSLPPKPPRRAAHKDMTAISYNVRGHTDVFKSLSPTGERKPKFHFGASPGGSAKAFENVVEQCYSTLPELHDNEK